MAVVMGVSGPAASASGGVGQLQPAPTLSSVPRPRLPGPPLHDGSLLPLRKESWSRDSVLQVENPEPLEL